MSSNEMIQLLRELESHLLTAVPGGLPAHWFSETATVSPEHHPEPVTPAVTQSPPVVEEASEPVLADVQGHGISALSFEELRNRALSCRACRLHETRCNVVFGVGLSENPRLVFVGEGPGAEEDRTGEPFVGRAGELLTGAITKGMGLRREDVYICNVVKCRPPENRAPLPDEVAACTPYLYRQLELLKPEVIVALGGPAQLALSGVAGGITKIRGQWQEWRGIRVMPTFHPAYILRNPSAKRSFWADLQEVMRVLGLERPAAR